MPVSAAKVVMISIFMIGGMLLAGIIMQPEASLQAWDVKESGFPANSSQEDRLAFLLQYAILAPSSHNSQPWKFNVSEDKISIYADETRWLSVADRDQRELYISLGCALENLVVAAEHFGYICNVTYFPGQQDLVAELRLKSSSQLPTDANSFLFPAITSRQTNRHPYEDRLISAADLNALYKAAANGSSPHQESLHWQSLPGQIQAPLPGAAVFLREDPATRDRFQQLSVQADRVQYSDADYKAELGHWLSLGGMGPTGLQAKAAQLAVLFLDMGPDQMAKDAQLINSTPYIGFVCTEKWDLNGMNDANQTESIGTKISALMAGRAFERFWLAATALGLSLHPMSQALEVQETKEQLSQLIMPTISGEMSQVQQTFRLGYAQAPGDHTPRRPMQDVLVS